MPPKQPSEVSDLPKEVREKAVQAGVACYSMGIIGAAIETALTSEKNTDGSYKNPWNEKGREKIRDTCFDDLAAPKIRGAGGNNEDVAQVRNEAEARVRASRPR